MEKWNSQLEHGQPMEQTRGLFCTCDSGRLGVNYFENVINYLQLHWKLFN